MRRRERLCLLLAAGASLGVHAAAAVWFSYLSPSAVGLSQPPTQIVQISVVAPRTVTPDTVPDPVAEAAPAPLKRKLPKPRSRPVPARVQPEHIQPTPEPETVASLPAEPATQTRPENTGARQPQASPATASAAESYLARLLAHIDSHKFYPRGARQRGQEGDVHVTFYLLQDGRIRALEASGSSRLLREAAERAVQTALPLPQPPAAIDLREQISFSMQFRLKG